LAPQKKIRKSGRRIRPPGQLFRFPDWKEVEDPCEEDLQGGDNFFFLLTNIPTMGSSNTLFGWIGADFQDVKKGFLRKEARNLVEHLARKRSLHLDLEEMDLLSVHQGRETNDFWQYFLS